MSYPLGPKPDLGHINGCGGTLFSTILHEAENNPNRAGRDDIACLCPASEEGVALPRHEADLAGNAKVAEFPQDWAGEHPEQVVEQGIV